MRNIRSRKKRNRLSKLLILFIVVLQIATASFISCLLVFYGPFPLVREMVVGTAMSSYTHQYIAKMFLTDAQISKILNSGITSIGSAGQNTSEIVMNYNDNSIERYEINGSKFKGYMLVIHNPLRVKVGYSNKLSTQGERTSDISKDHNAIAAINGGGFSDKSSSGSLWAGTGAYPEGFVISQGKIVYQGISDKDSVNVVALDAKGKLILGSHSINDLLRMKATEAVEFGPPLIINGKAAFKGDGGQGITARTAIGQRKDGAILLLVLDGRRVDMPGATLHDLQKIMLDYKAWNAGNLDGGSSITMYFQGNVINDPCNPLGERTIATAFYVES